MAKPKSNRRRTVPAAERREAILDAALECFVERGFHGTAVPQVAKAASIATGTIYHYFPSKEVMVNALFRKWKGEIATRVLIAFPQNAGPREQFQVMWREMVDFALANPRAFAFLELHHHGSYLDDESRLMENNLKDFGSLMVQQAQAQGIVKAGPTALLMELVFGSFIGMMRAHGEGRIALDAEERAIAEQACWDTIAAAAG